ncbi:MAG: RICIN domain-containing protein [Xanthobacteraceae bacterium]|nr:RICIN domain-containing protein [Xanthobacteraceae bacterium]
MRKPIVTAAILAVLNFILPAPAQQPGRLIVNQISGMCLDVPGISNRTPGTPLQLYDCEVNRVDFSGKPSDQFWFFGVQGQIRNSLSGMCIDITGTHPGANLVIAICNPANPAQSWIVRPDGFIQNSATGKCIDVAGFPGVGRETPLLHSDCEVGHPQTDQRWRY